MKPIRGSARAGDVQPDMNVTPLVDIVLVLLIIFMVVAPRLDQDLPVELPGIFNPDPDLKSAIDPIKITVAQAGEYHIDESQYDLESAVGYLITLHEVDPDRRVVLRADAKLKYGDVRDIFARCQQIGFPGISLLVGEKHKTGVLPPAAPPGSGQGESAPVPPPQPEVQGG
ncbi:MAG: biopolymer transporter ExbD [Deltaproteobacteria bacterium]|nr:biopolymer transporter ExbD [Deltaproteobacteria bacterium]